jgi:hypothetical protein
MQCFRAASSEAADGAPGRRRRATEAGRALMLELLGIAIAVLCFLGALALIVVLERA